MNIFLLKIYLIYYQINHKYQCADLTRERPLKILARHIVNKHNLMKEIYIGRRFWTISEPLLSEVTCAWTFRICTKPTNLTCWVSHTRFTQTSIPSFNIWLFIHIIIYRIVVAQWFSQCIQRRQNELGLFSPSDFIYMLEYMWNIHFVIIVKTVLIRETLSTTVHACFHMYSV